MESFLVSVLSVLIMLFVYYRINSLGFARVRALAVLVSILGGLLFFLLVINVVRECRIES